MAAQIITNVTIFLMLLDMAINVDYRDMIRTARQTGLVLRAALSVLVVVPLLSALPSAIMHIPLETRIALGVLAAAPGAPLTAKRAAGLGSKLSTAMALQLILVNMGVFWAPLTLWIMAYRHGFELSIPISTVAWQIFTVQFIPLAIGGLLRWKGDAFLPRIRRPLTIIANLSMLALIILVFIFIGPVLLRLDAATWAALLIFSAGALLSGHVLGGPSTETRAAVAVASANRNLGLATLLGVLVGDHFPKAKGDLTVLIMAFALVNFIAGTIYQIIVRRIYGRASSVPEQP